MKRTVFVLIFWSIIALETFAQGEQSNKSNYNQPPIEPLQNISQEITKISKSIQTFNAGIRELLDKLTVGKGGSFSERQQKLLLGFEVLNRAEQRLEILQKFQIELTQKDGEVKTRLAKVEEELLPGSIDRNIALIGTTKADEMRDTRRRTLDAERRSLQALIGQIYRNAQQNNDELQKAENFVQMLRRKVLPQIEIEISDL